MVEQAATPPSPSLLCRMGRLATRTRVGGRTGLRTSDHQRPPNLTSGDRDWTGLPRPLLLRSRGPSRCAQFVNLPRRPNPLACLDYHVLSPSPVFPDSLPTKQLHGLLHLRPSSVVLILPGRTHACFCRRSCATEPFYSSTAVHTPLCTMTRGNFVESLVGSTCYRQGLGLWGADFLEESQSF
ncbi:hypothetical protein B0H14DRAFT_2785298 [Mycena olivaceomarginata]|nr:hypothetical protein B0H14DRAFT_2785298 [Mycena olivaceomarginata]